MKLEKALTIIEDIGKYDGSEWGTYCMRLLDYWNCIHYGAPDGLIELIKDEIIAHAETFEEEYKLIERTETITKKYVSIEPL